MAGDWIKLRMDLPDDPAVIAIAAELEITEDEVVGKLIRLWMWADRQTVDGLAQAITARWVDRYLGLDGFADAMVNVGWLSFTDSAMEFPHFERHMGESAKKRTENTSRQRLSRISRDKSVTKARQKRDQRREEKRREEREETPPTPSGSKTDSIEIPSELDTPSFLAAWSDWLTHRKQIKKPATELAATKQLKALAKRGTNDAIRAIEHSIANGWQGIFDPDERAGRAGSRLGRVEAKPGKYAGRPGSEHRLPDRS